MYIYCREWGGMVAMLVFMKPIIQKLPGVKSFPRIACCENDPGSMFSGFANGLQQECLYSKL